MTGGAVAVHEAGDFGYLINPNRRWNNNKRLIILNAWIMLLLITSSTSGYDGSMMNGLQSLPQWNEYFDSPTGGKLGLFNAIQTIGGLAGFPFTPYMCDGIGRRWTIFFGAVIMVGATAVQTCSQSLGMFMGARFMIGFGLTFASGAAPLLVTELSYPTYRAPLTSLYNSLWYSGAIIAAWTTFGTFKIESSWSWRTPSLLQGLPSVIQVCLVLFCPESPRWLIAKGRDAEALKTLAYYHADGDEQDDLVQYEFEEIKAAIELDQNIAANVGHRSLFTTPGNRKRMHIIIALAFFSQWSGNGLVGYYLNQVFNAIGITNPTTQLLINGILQIWNLAWAIGAAFMVDRAGRRLLFLASTAGMLLFYVLQTACFATFSEHNSNASAYALIVFIFLYFAAYDIAYTPLIVSYTVEILPYRLRAKGFNIFNFAVSLSLIFNQYVNPIAFEKMGWKYYLVYVAWIAFELVYVYFFIVETKNLSLESIAVLFDGEQIAQELAHAHQARESPEDREKEGLPLTSPTLEKGF